MEQLEKFVQVVHESLTLLSSAAPVNNSGPRSPYIQALSPAQTDYIRPLMRRRTQSTTSRDCPSSFENILKLAQSSLAQNGIVPCGQGEMIDGPPGMQEQEIDSTADIINAGRSITSLDESRACALVDVFASDALTMYPCVNIESVRQDLAALYRLELSSTSPTLRSIDIEILKAVLAVGASSKVASDSALARSLVSDLLWSVEGAFSEDILSIEDVVMSSLMVRYAPYSLKLSSRLP